VTDETPLTRDWVKPAAGDPAAAGVAKRIPEKRVRREGVCKFIISWMLLMPNRPVSHSWTSEKVKGERTIFSVLVNLKQKT
jgi:hypothetical protein